jgi:hypothetical protein
MPGAATLVMPVGGAPRRGILVGVTTLTPGMLLRLEPFIWASDVGVNVITSFSSASNLSPQKMQNVEPTLFSSPHLGHFISSYTFFVTEFISVND